MKLDRIALGCHNLTGGTSYTRSERLVRCALDLGIRRFDVAPSYGSGTAEATLSHALARQRLDERIAITTKYGLVAPRLAFLAAWAREPLRIVRGYAQRSVQNLSDPSSATRTQRLLRAQAYSGTARGAIEASLRKLRVERIATYLSHERLIDPLAERFDDDMTALIRDGLIGNAGCSGEIENVLGMLRRAPGSAKVAQVSLRHHDAVTAVNDIRLFNLGAVASEAALDREGCLATFGALREALNGAKELDQRGLGIAGVLSWALFRFPQATMIVNASSALRLRALIEAASNSAADRWAQEHATAMDRLLHRRTFGTPGQPNAPK